MKKTWGKAPWYSSYEKNNYVDILHVDLSNEPEILEEIIPHWIDKVRYLIIVEGGSLQRDRVFG